MIRILSIFGPQIRHVPYRFEQCEQPGGELMRAFKSPKIWCVFLVLVIVPKPVLLVSTPPRAIYRQERRDERSAGPLEALKIRRGAGSTSLVGIICTLVEIGLTDAPKSGATRTHGSDRPAADGRDTALTHSVCFSPLFFSIKQEKFPSLFQLEVSYTWLHKYLPLCIISLFD